MTSRRPLWIALTAVGLVIVFLAGTSSVALYVVARAASRPEAIVSRYLSQVESGHIEAAMRLEGRKPGQRDVLLTDRAYADATDRLSSFRVTGVTRTSSSSVLVDTELHAGGTTSRASFTVRRGPWTLGDLVGVVSWRLQPVPLSTVELRVGVPGHASAKVGESRVAWNGSPVRLLAFPGRYSMTADASSPWFTVAGTQAFVEGFNDLIHLDAPATLTQKGIDAAKTAATSSVSACLAKSDQSTGCSFDIDRTGAEGEVWTNAAWTVVRMPDVAVTAAWDFDCRVPGSGVGPGCWDVTTVTQGAVEFQADYRIPATGETGTVSLDQPAPVDIEGVVSDVDSTGATFHSISWQ